MHIFRVEFALQSSTGAYASRLGNRKRGGCPRSLGTATHLGAPSIRSSIANGWESNTPNQTVPRIWGPGIPPGLGAPSIRSSIANGWESNTPNQTVPRIWGPGIPPGLGAPSIRSSIANGWESNTPNQTVPCIWGPGIPPGTTRRKLAHRQADGYPQTPMHPAPALSSRRIAKSRFDYRDRRRERLAALPRSDPPSSQ